jgi:hypothetical protein
MAKRPKVKLSSHAQQRFEERTEKMRDEFLSFSQSAQRKGLMWAQIDIIHPELNKTQEGKRLKQYMQAFSGRKKKYYKGNIFIFTSVTRKLITMFPCKEEFLNVLEDYWNEVYRQNKVFKKISKK